MSKENFELVAFPQERVTKTRDSMNGELLQYHIDEYATSQNVNLSAEDALSLPKVDVRIYVVTPEGKPAIRIQMA